MSKPPSKTMMKMASMLRVNRNKSERHEFIQSQKTKILEKKLIEFKYSEEFYTTNTFISLIFSKINEANKKLSQNQEKIDDRIRVAPQAKVSEKKNLKEDVIYCFDVTFRNEDDDSLSQSWK